MFWIFFRLGKPKNSLLFVFQQTEISQFSRIPRYSIEQRERRGRTRSSSERSHGLEILQRTACVSLSCVPLSTVFLVINEPCVYFWVCLSEDNIHMREVHVDNYKYEDELELFIQLLNKTALQEIGARDTVTIGNPPLCLRLTSF